MVMVFRWWVFSILDNKGTQLSRNRDPYGYILVYLLCISIEQLSATSFYCFHRNYTYELWFRKMLIYAKASYGHSPKHLMVDNDSSTLLIYYKLPNSSSVILIYIRII